MEKRLAFRVIAMILIMSLSVYSFLTWGRSGQEENLPTFTDVTDAARVRNPYGIYPFINWLFGPSASFGDYDNDGYLDLYIVNYRKPNILYHNNGNGTFTDVTKKAGVGFVGMGTGCTWADYNNDGYLDLYVTNWDICQIEEAEKNFSRVGEANVLFRNNGNGTFTDVTKEAGVGDENRHAAGAAWGDYDNDGYLDLYVANYGDTRFFWHHMAAEPDVLYHNNGNGTFTDVTEKAGIKDNAWSLQPIWFDYNVDGFLDLFVANDIGVSQLYHNNGDGTFTDVTKKVGFGQWAPGMGVDVGDIDNDGDLDLYQTNYDLNYLWKNNGNSTFTRITEGFSVIERYISMGVHIFDFDNDGDQDICVVNGYMGESSDMEINEPAQLFTNQGDGTFKDVARITGLVNEVCGRGATFGDYDNDGDVDIYVVNVNAPSVLFRNDGGNRNNWLVVRLKGTKSNRFGVGATVTVTTGSLKQIKTLICGSSYLCGNGLQLEFGLAKYGTVDMMEITWPSGMVQRIYDVAVNQILTITEP